MRTVFLMQSTQNINESTQPSVSILIKSTSPAKQTLLLKCLLM